MDSGSPRFKHQLVASDMLARIQAGEWPVGSRVPSVDTLAAAYPYSRMTVFKAVQELVGVGCLRVERGVGTFVVRARRTGCIGFVISDDVFYPERSPVAGMMLRSSRDYFERAGFSLKLYVESPWAGPGQPVSVPGLGDDLQQAQLKGLLTAGANLPVHLGAWPLWQEAAVPHVDVSSHRVTAHRVDFDYDGMMAQALDYLVGDGRRHVALIGVWHKRGVADAQAMAASRGVTIVPAACPADTDSGSAEAVGYAAMQSALTAPAMPDSVLICDDIMAKGAIQAVLQAGISVPEQLRVVSHANKDSGVFYPVEVVRLEFDIDEVVRAAGDRLLDLIATPGLSVPAPCVRASLRLPLAAVYV
jgi:DNA-binding LacI/PurR family transcriptional regulator